MSDFKEFFSKNAGAYAQSESHRSGTDLSLLMNSMHLAGSMVALDLASGTGFTAMALAEHVSRVVAFDGTPEMLEQAKKLASEKGISNIEYSVGDVANLPFPDNSFDIVTCRRAAHHFTDKPRFLSEAFRVLKPGGKLGLVDMARPETDKDDIFNSLERIRDASHVGAEKVSSWEFMLAEAGFLLEEKNPSVELYTIRRWLSPVPMESRQGEDVLKLIESTDRMLLKAANVDYKDLTILKPRIGIIAMKPMNLAK